MLSVHYLRYSSHEWHHSDCPLSGCSKTDLQWAWFAAVIVMATQPLHHTIAVFSEGFHLNIQTLVPEIVIVH